jgi:hypothetical protein
VQLLGHEGANWGLLTAVTNSPYSSQLPQTAQGANFNLLTLRATRTLRVPRSASRRAPAQTLPHVEATGDLVRRAPIR